MVAHRILTLAAAAMVVAADSVKAEQAIATRACSVTTDGKRVTLESPAFAFTLDTSDGLRAASWKNRVTGRLLGLGNGPEVGFDLGLPQCPLRTPKLRVTKIPAVAEGPSAEAVFELTADDPKATVTVTYRCDAKQPVLRKFVHITNRSGGQWDRLLNVRLGDYLASGVEVADRPARGHHSIHVPRKFPLPDSTHVERGFPVYVADEFFVTLAHPSGVAEGADGRVSLRQYPGARLAAGGTFHCMEAVYGVASAGGAREAFLDHIISRMRRVLRGHDGPYAIFEPFGARPNGSFDETEEFVLDSIAKVAESQRQTGLRFDFYCVDFWVDYRGTLTECDPQRFPNGLRHIKKELASMGTALGLWIDSSWERWSIGGNPRVQGCLNVDPQRPDTARKASWSRKSFCRATEPIRSMYVDGFRHHIRENKVRLLKFDNLANTCQNPEHAHLTGVYSTEPITDAVIEFLHALDRENPEVFLMLYWGYRSPWWLLDGDTLFDSGLDIEAASPSTLPAPHARDSVTHKLDQAQWHVSDVPALGKDSLGVWLSDWPWNSQIGKQRWQEGFIMDLCRGSLLAQPWSDTPWLTPPEREQMAEFIGLFKAQPECFRNPRFVVGNPQRDEPYGYACSDGKRAFVALHNCSWKDNALTLQLSPDWGLPAGQAWHIFRWYPEPAKLRGEDPAFRETAVIALRPFQVVLLEFVPAGHKPSLDRAFEERPMPTSFPVVSRDVDIATRRGRDEPPESELAKWTVIQPYQAVSTGGATLTLQHDGSVLASDKTASPDTYTITADTALTGIMGLRLEALADESLPGRGPGRAVNGNFALTQIRVKAFPRGKPAQAIEVPLRNPRADFEQTSHGGWPAGATLDDDPKTGWSIDPEEGHPHEVIFETPQPIGFEGDTALVLELDQGDREHSLGRFRISATAASPVPAPQRWTERLVVRGEAPASPEDGLLVLTVEMTKDDKPRETRNIGSLFSTEGTLDGEPVTWQPVLGQRTYPSCWQAWRLPIETSSEPREFELTILPRVGSNILLRCSAHFVPR